MLIDSYFHEDWVITLTDTARPAGTNCIGLWNTNNFTEALWQSYNFIWFSKRHRLSFHSTIIRFKEIFKDHRIRGSVAPRIKTKTVKRRDGLILRGQSLYLEKKIEEVITVNQEDAIDWVVVYRCPSLKYDGLYHSLDPKYFTCTYYTFIETGHKCAHLYGLEYHLKLRNIIPSNPNPNPNDDELNPYATATPTGVSVTYTPNLPEPLENITIVIENEVTDDEATDDEATDNKVISNLPQVINGVTDESIKISNLFQKTLTSNIDQQASTSNINQQTSTSNIDRIVSSKLTEKKKKEKGKRKQILSSPSPNSSPTVPQKKLLREYSPESQKKLNFQSSKKRGLKKDKTILPPINDNENEDGA